MDRNQLEQEALRQLNLGSHEGALRAYLQILRIDARDRRIRQKVGELCLKLGRPADAERHFREVADGLVKEGSHRAAVAVLKQLIALRADDPALQFDLAECYLASGYANDARVHFDTAMRLWINVGKAMDAARAARRIADLAPGEPALRLKVAELLEAGGDGGGAAGVYADVADEYRRRGRPDEVGRIAEIALRLRPDDMGLLLDAANARVEAGEHKRALQHLQQAFAQNPREARTLDLLARAFEGVGQPDKAFKVISELARVVAERGDPVAEVDALRRAARLAPDDADVQDRLAQAEGRVSRMERRVTQLDVAQPGNEPELRTLVRAEVFQRYGFVDRAEVAVREALDAASGSAPLLAAWAELHAAAGRSAEAVGVLERLLPLAGADADAVRERIGILRGLAGTAAQPMGDAGPDPSASNAAPRVFAASGAVADDAARMFESAVARGDRLAEAGDLAGAMLAWREALAERPGDETLLARIVGLRDRLQPAPAAAAPEADPEDAFADFVPLEDGVLDEVEPEAVEDSEPDTAPAEGDLDEARSLVAVGMWADALALLEGATQLEAVVLRAQALRGSGDVAGALEALRDAVDDAAEDDPAYHEALFELSTLYTANGKARAAVRTLEELKGRAPGFRGAEVEARLRGLSRLLK